MTPPRTDIRISFTIVTVQLQPTELTTADLRSEAAVFRRLTHANDLARDGKLYMHKASCSEERKDGQGAVGAMQGPMFNIDQSDGKAEMREFIDGIKATVLERMWAKDEGSIITE